METLLSADRLNQARIASPREKIADSVSGQGCRNPCRSEAEVNYATSDMPTGRMFYYSDVDGARLKKSRRNTTEIPDVRLSDKR